MSDHSPSAAFHTANPHALATILEASETRSIIASSDIFDINGMKLWARDQPVSRDLQRKLMDRALKQPLETCLMAEDGVSNATLQAALQQLINGQGPLTPLLQPHAEALVRCAGTVRLHSVVQLLLSAVETARPAAFQHAIDAMAVAGAGQGPRLRHAGFLRQAGQGVGRGQCLQYHAADPQGDPRLGAEKTGGDDMRRMMLGESSEELKRKTGLFTRLATKVGAATGATWTATSTGANSTYSPLRER